MQYKYDISQESNNDFLIELYNECKKLDEKNVKWMMTQKDNKNIRDIFKEYNIKKYKVYRIFDKSFK